MRKKSKIKMRVEYGMNERENKASGTWRLTTCDLPGQTRFLQSNTWARRRWRRRPAGGQRAASSDRDEGMRGDEGMDSKSLTRNNATESHSSQRATASLATRLSLLDGNLHVSSSMPWPSQVHGQKSVQQSK